MTRSTGLNILSGALFCAFAAFAAYAFAQEPAPPVAAPSLPEELVVDRFSGEPNGNGAPRGWKPFLFPKKDHRTVYSVEREGENYFVKAVSNSSASAIYREISVDLKEYPVLSWRWKVEGTVKNGDESKKAGDDYAARVYVAFEYMPEKTPFFDKIKYQLAKSIYGVNPPGDAINYIWANRLKKDGAVRNAFTDKVVMIAVESGPEDAGKWLSEERNVYEDYKRHFKGEPPRITGVILMTDTDNTKESAVGYYDDIVFKRAAATPNEKKDSQ